MDRQSDRLPRQTRCEGMRIKREIQMGASGGGQSIKASGIAAQTGRTQTCNRHDSPKPKTPLIRGGRPHKLPSSREAHKLALELVSSKAKVSLLNVQPPLSLGGLAVFETRGTKAIIAGA